jgi:predicted SAM-dependent methyltransferase
MSQTPDEEPPADLLKEVEGRKLHLGGVEVRAGWEIFNAQKFEGVDHIGDIKDLSRFETGSFSMVYASHVFEHLSYQGALHVALAEVSRVLAPGGRFLVSVPDLMTLCRIFASPKADEQLRYAVMRMMFGGQIDPYDFHYVGLWDDFLASALGQAGFSEVHRVPRFDIFKDASSVAVGSVLISLNLVAIK